MSRQEYTQDPLSPFQPFSHSNKPSKPKSQPKTDLDFIQKVTNAGGGSGGLWDQKGVMGKASLVATKEKTSHAVKAFQELRRRRRVKDEFTQFCNETSFTPLTRIYNATSWKRQIGWTILLLGMLCWLGVQCFWLLDNYFSYPVEVKMDILADTEMDFPSVTVCNLNPIKKTSMQSDPDFRDLNYFTDQISKNDPLYDLVYNNYDSLYNTQSPWGWSTINTPASTVTLPTVATTPQTLATTPTATTANAATTPQSVTTTTTAGSSQSSTTPLVGGGGPVGRKKRDVDDDRGQPSPAPGVEMTLQDPNNDDNNNQRDKNNKNQNNHKNNKNDVEDAIAQAAEWRNLEKELFGEESAGKLDRQRRSGSGSEEHRDRLESMKNSSFNKWDALGSVTTNTSYYETRGDEYKAAQTYATLTAVMNETKVKASGHSLSDLLLSCSFNGWPCSPINFTDFHSHKYGNCFTFNSHESPSQLKTKFPGPEYGLTLEMFIQQDEYVPALGMEAGVRVLIHPRGRAPFPVDEGLSIPPQHSTAISIRQVKMIRLGAPHGTCDDSASFTDMYRATLNTTYSKLACLKSCYQDIALRHCNCSLPMYIVTDRTRVCNMTDPAVDSCTSLLHSQLSAEYSACDLACPQPCYETDYEKLVSSAAWPSENYKKILENKVMQSNYLLMGGANDDNFVKLTVYFKDLMFEKIEQQKAYESENLISDIGGQLGLWLGLSAITIGELCGLALTLFRSITVRVSPDDKRQGAPSSSSSSAFSRDLQHGASDVMLSDVKAGGYV